MAYAIISNVTMWAALDEAGNFVFIEDAENGKDYYCPLCGGIVHSRAKESDLVTEHFYHLNKENCDGGESTLHKYWKHHIVDVGETIELPQIGKVECVERWIEYNTKKGDYRPDLIIKTTHPKYRFIIIEIQNANRKIIENYNEIWETYKYPVYEIDVKKLNKNKDNLSDCIRLLYSVEKDRFVREKRRQINCLYRTLDSRNCKEEFEKYWTLKKSINRVNNVLKSGLNKPIRTDLDGIIFDLDRTFVSRYTFLNFTIPLKKIVEELKVYK